MVGHFEFLFITIRLLRVVEDKSLLTLIKIEVHTTPVCTESNYRDQLLLNWNFVAFANMLFVEEYLPNGAVSVKRESSQ